MSQALTSKWRAQFFPKSLRHKDLRRVFRFPYDEGVTPPLTLGGMIPTNQDDSATPSHRGSHAAF
jgi:hypothetical protein